MSVQMEILGFSMQKGMCETFGDTQQIWEGSAGTVTASCPVRGSCWRVHLSHTEGPIAEAQVCSGRDQRFVINIS